MQVMGDEKEELVASSSGDSWLVGGSRMGDGGPVDDGN